MKKLRLSQHAKERILERGITKGNIKSALARPDITMPCRDPKRKRLMKKIGDKTLDVIFVEKRTAYIIVTAVWLNKGG